MNFDVETVGSAPSVPLWVARGPLWMVFLIESRLKTYNVCWADHEGVWYQVLVTMCDKRFAIRFAKQMVGYHPDEPV